MERHEAKMRGIAGAFLCLSATLAAAGGLPTGEVEELVVTAEPGELAGTAQSASQGLVLEQQIRQRPVSRTAELLELVPGLIATQHSSEGKANQYFLRGFNLDHGTDFATRVAGMPVNLRSHGHGQGYSDINFVIPALVSGIAYRKGVYYADVGDFSAAGSADMRYARQLDRPVVELGAGANGYQRITAAGSRSTGAGAWLAAVDANRYDGPWQLDQDLRQHRTALSYTHALADSELRFMLMGYDGDWTATDQIPDRVASSEGRLGFVDPMLGGESSRYSASFDWRSAAGMTYDWRVSGYAIDYALDLFSNFTYFLDDPVNGDQFEQLDERRVHGLDSSVSRDYHALPGEPRVTLGYQYRRDDVGTVGLYNTRDRERLATVREDSLREHSHGGYVSVEQRWSDWLRSVAGLRYDRLHFDVDSDLTLNSGAGSDDIVSPKLSVVLGPWRDTELFVNVGRGFHSNDVRGAVIRVDPNDAVTPVDAVQPLVGARGVDIGIRSALSPTLQLAASIWGLALDSELVYAGDGGATEASSASRRYGIETTAIWQPLPGWIVDADLALTHARLDGVGDDRIPGAVERVASLGAGYEGSRWSAGLRLRHLGEAPLVEDNSERSETTFVVNGQVRYRVSEQWTVTLQGFNLLDSDDNDVSYFYESRLADEAQPVADVHFHPVEPRSFRVSMEWQL